jgi:VWFA-related protein
MLRSRTPRHLVRTICALAALLVPLVPLGAQAADDAGETFFEAIQVGVAEVEVVVTDAEGRRITDLRQDEFALYEDGQRVELSHFQPPAATVTATGEVTLLPAEMAVEPAENRALCAIFGDNVSLTVSARARLLRSLRDRLEAEWHAGTDVMVVAHDAPGSLRILRPPTSDHALAATALDEIERVVPPGTLWGAGGARIVRDIELAPDPAAQDENDPGGGANAEAEALRLHQEIRNHAEQVRQQAVATARALGTLVEALAGLPGRKAVLLVSGGLSERPAQALLSAWDNKYRFSGRQYDLGSELESLASEPVEILEEVAQQANGNRVTLYAVAATDVVQVGGAELRSNEIWTIDESHTETFNLANSIQRLVGPTGGLTSINAGNPGLLLDDLVDDLGASYVLGYTPGAGREGLHKVRVEVSRPGLKVRHRESRRARAPREVMVERTQAGLLLGYQDNPLQVEVEWGYPSPGEKRGTEVLPLTVKLPMSGLVLVPNGAFHEGRLTVYIAARDSEGRGSPVTEVLVPIRVPNEQLLVALSQTAAYRTRLEMRDTSQHVAVSVRDELGNVAATVTASYPPVTEEPSSVVEPPAGSPPPEAAPAPSPAAPAEAPR